MKQETLDKIHKVTRKFEEAIEEEVKHKNVALFWAVIEDDKIGTGIVVGDDIEQKELADIMFQLNGRAYKMIK